MWRSAPLFLAGALAVAGAVHLLPSPPIAAPLRLMIVAAAMLLGIGATFLFDRGPARPYWQLVLAVIVVEMPVIALQSSGVRVPFVALGRGSAGPVLWMTLASLIMLAGLWVFALLQPSDPAENASLLLLLPALIVPAILGAGADLDETTSLAMLGQSALLAGGAVFLALLGPIGWRPLIAVATFVLQCAFLWLSGKGPAVGPEAGLVSFVSLGVVLLASLLLLITAPLGSLFTRRFFQTVGENSSTTTPASVPMRGARRRNDP